tara:strand:+ start:5892 stop:6023 length:132 start_codon:yes stop_codon:yes gene_type:complete
MAGKTVTFALPSGAKVTCDPDLAKKLGHSEPKPRKAADSKSEK